VIIVCLCVVLAPGEAARIVRPWYRFAAVAQILGNVSSRHSVMSERHLWKERSDLPGSAGKEFGRA
jgi:hypothetical protein